MPENTLDIKIHRIIRSPKFIAGKKYNDIALLELEADVKFSKFIQPACLYHIPDVLKLSKKARATGWGIFSEGKILISCCRLKNASFTLKQISRKQ